MANSAELIYDLLALEFQLIFIGDHLPFAAATYAEMRAKGSDAPGGGLDEANQLSFRPVFTLANDPNFGPIPGNGPGHKDHFPLVSQAEALSFGGILGDFNL